MLNISKLSYTACNKVLFHNVNLILNNKRRYGLVGANGAGKSTLLRLITGDLELDEGSIQISDQYSIGWLHQDQFVHDNEIIINVVLKGKAELWQAMEQKEKILSQDVHSEQDGLRLAELEAIIGHYGGYSAENEASKLLEGLGIEQSKHYDAISELSGGFKIRVLLAQALFKKPNLLLLDEPTNHLDMPSIEWLENYLRQDFDNCIIFISHDHDFLNRLSTHILDIDYCDITMYHGNYDTFLKNKAIAASQVDHQRNIIADKKAHIQQFIDRFKAKASKAKQAKSKEKMLQRLELQQPDLRPSSRIAPNFKFNFDQQSSEIVISIKELYKEFDNNTIFLDLNLDIVREQKVAITGANGKGKSTLLKIIMGDLKQDIGKITYGNKVKIGYFSQDHTELMNDKDHNIFSWLEEHNPRESEQNLKAHLAAMLFNGEGAFNKKVHVLSGGEKARLLFANIMIKKPNTLILDEPTNHMDIESIEALQEALIQFKGTIVFVSHNRKFVHSIANSTLEVFDHNIRAL